jgi:hypothetical protein
MEVFDEMHQRDVSWKNIHLDETLYSALINMLQNGTRISYPTIVPQSSSQLLKHLFLNIFEKISNTKK